MKIEDTKKFYESDKKLYDVFSNEEFIKSFYEDGLESVYTLSEMQEVIDFICYWYEDKYTESELEYIEKYGVPDFKTMKKNMSDRSVDNLLEIFGDQMAYFLQFDKSKTKLELLNLVALKLLYSENTTPERGFERAKLFFTEFNNSVLDLRLNTSDVESLMDFNFDRLKIGDKMILEEFIQLPLKEAERFVKANYSKAFKENNSLNANYDSKGKVKTFTKRLFRK